MTFHYLVFRIESQVESEEIKELLTSLMQLCQKSTKRPQKIALLSALAKLVQGIQWSPSRWTKDVESKVSRSVHNLWCTDIDNDQLEYTFRELMDLSKLIEWDDLKVPIYKVLTIIMLRCEFS